LFNELTDFRKLMLIYRLIHFQDAVPDINVGLEGRDKELCKPLLQLFYNTKSYEEIRATLQIFLNAKNQKKSNLIEAALHPMIVNLVSRNGREVPAKRIWSEIISGSIIEGHLDDKRPNEYQSADYGTLYRNTITNIICDKFGAERKHAEHGNVLRFDPEKLVKVGNAYNIGTNIQTKVVDDEDGDPEGSESSEGSIEGRGSYTQNTHLKNTNNLTDHYKKSPNSEVNVANSSSQNYNKEVEALQEPSLPSDPPANEVVEQQIPNSIYRIGHSDLFACKNCKVKGDKPFMMKHPQYCKRVGTQRNNDGGDKK
jgi:hypothetical protein